MSERSIHPYKPYIPDGATKMIIGTTPPYRFCNGQALFDNDVNFYYGSRDNYFWELVEKATGAKLTYANTQEAIVERKKLLSALNMGMIDMVESCIHKDGKSDDKSLTDISTRNLSDLLARHPQIDTLIYTSRFVTSLVNYYADKQYHESWDKKRLNGSVTICGKKYPVHILYSPSPNALRGIEEDVRRAQYDSIFKTE
ncbi:hypothetical protein [Hominenteromicrobium sp.]|uniref:hypothetical protein n=1 Tax=Hominenteromicrobium sp. TaxID=3073581 RepID=UPI003A915639